MLPPPALRREFPLPPAILREWAPPPPLLRELAPPSARLRGLAPPLSPARAYLRSAAAEAAASGAASAAASRAAQKRSTTDAGLLSSPAGRKNTAAAEAMEASASVLAMEEELERYKERLAALQATAA